MKKINWKRLFKQISYRLSLFDFVKCVDCEWDGKLSAEVYCKPPLGACSYERKKDDIHK